MNCAVPVLKYRRAKLLLVATRVLGDEEKARAWLKHPQPSLDGAVPDALIETEDGLELALAALTST